MKLAGFFSDTNLAFQFLAFHRIYFILSHNLIYLECIKTFTVTDIIFQTTVPPNHLVHEYPAVQNSLYFLHSAHITYVYAFYSHILRLCPVVTFLRNPPHRGVRVLYCYVHRHKQDD